MPSSLDTRETAHPVSCFSPDLITPARMGSTAHRNTDVPPGHTIPPSHIHKPIPAQDVVAHIDVREVGDPTGDQVVAHDLDLGGRVQHSGGDEEHQPIGVAQLERHELGVVVNRRRQAGGGLFRDEPGWVEGRSGPTCEPGRGLSAGSDGSRGEDAYRLSGSKTVKTRRGMVGSLEAIFRPEWWEEAKDSGMGSGLQEYNQNNEPSLFQSLISTR